MLARMIVKMALVTCVVVLVRCQELQPRKPLYKYRYETEDLKTAASGLPVHGYHLVEGGYYPEPRFGNFGAPGGQLQRPLQPFAFQQQPQAYQPPIQALGVGGIGGIGGIGPAYGIQPHLHQLGGSISDKTVYQDGSQAQKDASFKNAHTSSGVQGHQDQEGFNRGEAQIRNGKGDTASYHSAQGQQQASEDGKNYQGAQHYNQQGQNAGEQNQKQGHKKGHIVKGFKTSHHKDETGRTEEYYDEANDEGGHFTSKGSSGSFGEEAKNAYKGGHDNGQFNKGESSKQGHVENVHHVDNANADKGDYAQKQTFGQGQTYGVNNGVDQQSLLGHQESNRFFKHHPIHTPFYKAY
ncbi:uncharacterized protein DDB_G0290685-like [Atheta coriaria]|uniref:uncharacterized protein DDB_G0290685-like n=1 Tax=Dalotia coriaria TaxID=877792 RepID=UPI0031F3E49B